MNWIERHWWVIIAIVALWWIANYGPKSTNTGDSWTPIANLIPGGG